MKLAMYLTALQVTQSSAITVYVSVNRSSVHPFRIKFLTLKDAVLSPQAQVKMFRSLAPMAPVSRAPTSACLSMIVV